MEGAYIVENNACVLGVRNEVWASTSYRGNQPKAGPYIKKRTNVWYNVEAYKTTQ